MEDGLEQHSSLQQANHFLEEHISHLMTDQAMLVLKKSYDLFPAHITKT
jgi:hypothetical protein